MAGMRLIIAWLGVALAAGCAKSAPPAELDGLWSAGQAACDAGVGIRFTPEAIVALYEDEAEVLFAAPRYELERGGEEFRVRISYALPRPAGGVAVVGARGELVLERAGTRLEATAHNMIDHRTGSARLRIEDDPAMMTMSLQPCDRHPWGDDLRGLTT